MITETSVHSAQRNDKSYKYIRSYMITETPSLQISLRQFYTSIFDLIWSLKLFRNSGICPSAGYKYIRSYMITETYLRIHKLHSWKYKYIRSYMITETNFKRSTGQSLHTSIFDLIWSLKHPIPIRTPSEFIQVYSILYDHWNDPLGSFCYF